MTDEAIAAQHPQVEDSRSESRSSAAGIRFDQVTVAYQGTVVLDSFDLSVEPGQVMALLGPSGSGKTTALRSVAGFVQPRSGHVYLGDRDVTPLPPYERGVGMVVQQYALFPHMKIHENVAFGLKARKVGKARVKERVQTALEMVGMADFTHRYPASLSGGQQQRVAIARAIAIEPKVLLLDEPLSALDAQLRSGMLAEIARLHRELPDVTILNVTHDQVEALTLADQIAVMDQARLIEVGAARQLYDGPSREFTASFLGNANLMRVEIRSRDPQTGLATVRLGESTVTVRDSAHVGEGRAVVCLRPHQLKLTQPSPDCNRIHGSVEEVQWRGESHRIYLRVAQDLVKVDAPTLRQPPSIGSDVTCYFEPEDVVLVPKDSQDES